MIKIKICGNTNLEDALYAAELGADMLGFIFADSPRKVSPALVQKISDQLPMTTAKVGVFVDEDVQKVNNLADECHLDYVQLHGSEDTDYCAQLTVPYIKVIRIKNEKSLSDLKLFTPSFFLLDTFDKDKAGGTGKTFDWNLAAKAVKATKYPVFLSGGLSPENIADAIKTVGPYGVDLNSGVESAPGVKDHKKLKKAIELIRSL